MTQRLAGSDNSTAAVSRPRGQELPEAIASFVGRQREIDEVCGCLAKSRLVTLTGPGGIGKTRLALEIARKLQTLFRDGAYFVDFAPVADPSLVGHAVGLALGVREGAGQSIEQTLALALLERNVLLVLDNCEHVIAACARVAEKLLVSAPGVSIIATSRERLNIPGETVWAVSALSYPRAMHSHTVRDLAAWEAPCLFAERAAAAQHGFVVLDANADAVALICERLDGIPLAIELAAARVPVLSPQQIAERLDHRFELLTGGARTAMPRHKTLRQMVDWSYELLAPPEQTLLRRISIFSGGCDLEAAEGVCADERIPAAEILSLLSDLIAKSLVISDTPSMARTRYRTLETFREYGLEKLSDAGELKDLQWRHARYYAAHAERTGEHLLSQPDLARRLDIIELDHANYRAALQFFSETRNHNPDCQLLGLRLAAGLAWFWELRDYFGEGRQWLLAFASPRPREGTAVLARALARAASIGFKLGHVRDAEELALEAVALGSRIGEDQAVSDALVALGDIACFSGQGPRAAKFMERAVDVSASLGGFFVARCAYELSEARFYQNRREEAIHELERAIVLSQGADGYYAGHALSQLGLVLADAGDLDRACSCLERSIILLSELGNVGTRLIAQARLGYVALRMGDADRARTLVREALGTSRHIGRRAGIAYSLGALGAVCAASGHDERAVILIAASQALLHSVAAAHPPSRTTSTEVELAMLRHRLPHDVFDQLWAEGSVMPLQDAISLALVLP